MLAKIFRNRSVNVTFSLGAFQSAPEEACQALDLDIGATVHANGQANGKLRTVYGEGDIAIHLLRLPENAVIQLRANTAFGVINDFEWADDGGIAKKEIITGLVIKEIVKESTET